MIISRRQDLKVSMGNYETYGFGASVSLSHTDLGYTDEEVRQGARSDGDYTDKVAAELATTCERLLADLLVQEIRDAQALTEEQRSFVLAAFQPATRKSKTVSRRK